MRASFASLLVAPWLVVACVGTDAVTDGPTDAGAPVDSGESDAGLDSASPAPDTGTCVVMAPVPFTDPRWQAFTKSGTNCSPGVDGTQLSCRISKEFSVYQRDDFFAGAAGLRKPVIKATLRLAVGAAPPGVDVILAQFREPEQARVELHGMATAAGVSLSVTGLGGRDALPLGVVVAGATATLQVEWAPQPAGRALQVALEGAPPRTFSTIPRPDGDDRTPLFQLGPYDASKALETSGASIDVSYAVPQGLFCD